MDNKVWIEEKVKTEFYDPICLVCVLVELVNCERTSNVTSQVTIDAAQA